MSFLTMNTGIVNMENNETDILIDIRYPNDTNADEIMAKFDAACANLTSNIKAENRGDSKPLFVDPDSRLVKDLMSVYQNTQAILSLVQSQLVVERMLVNLKTLYRMDQNFQMK